ncbi:hypothetical protein E2562_002190 [Oryza meyeriana var. granulata]|uniref:Uncharacterized protein n=1 Tax=Oryza meyeriana var. granulata TaxID=110450 RepID=A0A6G1EDV5_9ORYZ|nr:hypothetical protein E2562_002190 [Oryza meyeriana var. granulata]
MAWTKWEEQRHGRSPVAAVENASQRTEYARSSGGGERPRAAWTGEARGLATSGSRALSTPMPMSYAIAADKANDTYKTRFHVDEYKPIR